MRAIRALRRRSNGSTGGVRAETDDTVLSIIEGEVLGTRYIKELLALVDNAPDQTAWLLAERDRLQAEVDRLVASIAAGVPGEVVAPLITQNRAAITRLEGRLRVPRVPQLGQERLRAALEQRAAEWKADLRSEPHLARLVLRKLVGPIVLFDDSKRPAFVKWEAQPTAELLAGLAPTLLGTSPMPASWNQIAGWLRQIDSLRQAA